MVAFLFLGLVTTANASNILEEVANQKVDIEDGYRLGKISDYDVNLLRKEQKRITKVIRKAEKDGVISDRERSKILRLQDRAKGNISYASNIANRAVVRDSAFRNRNRSAYRYGYGNRYGYGSSFRFRNSRRFRGGFCY